MLDVLDRAFVRHLERLTGTGEGIHGLSMGLVTVACIVLMTEHVGDTEASETPPLDLSELREGLSEMGLDDPERLETALGEMARKGYVEIDARDRLLPGKPTLSMARLLDHAFPGMPGINLVAYFVQTLDEVETGRKQPKKALQQLDQMLRHHGAAPFGKAKKEPQDRPAPPRRPRVQRPARLRAPVLRGVTTPPEKAAGSEPLPCAAPPPEVEETPETPMPSRELPEERPSGGVEVQEEQEQEEARGERGAVEPPEDGSTAEPLPDETEPAPPEPDPDPSLEPDGEAAVEEPVPEAAPPDPAEAPELLSPREQEPASDPEERVEDRVSAFEEELAMQCPVCRQASVEVRETGKGRVYYKCSDEGCMFISWGRPHHIPCPLCGNPFLVELDVDGDPKPLKCPRATCRYREPPAGTAPGGRAPERGEVGAGSGGGKPRRRVVRRKVRRRKR